MIEDTPMGRVEATLAQHMADPAVEKHLWADHQEVFARARNLGTPYALTVLAHLLGRKVHDPRDHSLCTDNIFEVGTAMSEGIDPTVLADLIKAFLSSRGPGLCLDEILVDFNHGVRGGTIHPTAWEGSFDWAREYIAYVAAGLDHQAEAMIERRIPFHYGAKILDQYGENVAMRWQWLACIVAELSDEGWGYPAPVRVRVRDLMDHLMPFSYEPNLWNVAGRTTIMRWVREQGPARAVLLGQAGIKDNDPVADLDDDALTVMAALRATA